MRVTSGGFRAAWSGIFAGALAIAGAGCSSNPPTAGPPPSGLVGASISDWRLTGRVDSKSHCDRTDAPKVISSHQARYPEALVRKKVQGSVSLQATVGADGVPGEFKVVRADDKALSDLALESFREWRYKPALCDGKPVDAYVTGAFTFRLQS
jgi:TonB family protein